MLRFIFWILSIKTEIIAKKNIASEMQVREQLLSLYHHDLRERILTLSEEIKNIRRLRHIFENEIKR